MDVPGLSFRELLDYTAGEAARWHAWFRAQPVSVLALPALTGREATVGALVRHIFLVERRYVDRLLGDTPTPYESVPADDVEALFAAGRDARERLERWLATATQEDLAARLEFQTITAGTLSASARKIVAHALLHGVRHWAQLATLLRQQGYATDWMHDLLMSDALD
jgi:uncharacterized damage-inducible protein DinB